MAADPPRGGKGTNQYQTKGGPVGNHRVEALRHGENLVAVRLAAHTPEELLPDPDPDIFEDDTVSPSQPPSGTRVFYSSGRPTHPEAGKKFYRRAEDRGPDVPVWMTSSLPHMQPGAEPLSPHPLTPDSMWDRLGVDEGARRELESDGVSAFYADACVGARITDPQQWRRLSAAGVDHRIGASNSIAGYQSWDVSDPEEMAAYAEAGVGPIDAWRYRNSQITDPQTIVTLRDARVEGVDARWTLQSGWDANDAVAFNRAGLTGLDVAAATEAGCVTRSEVMRVVRPRLRDRVFRRRGSEGSPALQPA